MPDSTENRDHKTATSAAVLLGANRFRSASLVLLSCVLGAIISCSNLPRDPKQTLRRVQTQPMRVGLIEHPPWVIRANGEPRGVEVELVRQFANELGTTPEWHWGGAQQQMEALEHYGLDLVIGGFTSRSPWKDYVGFTAPYFEESIRVAAPPGTSVKTVKGVQVIAEDDWAASLLQEEGATVIRVNQIQSVTGPVAAADWRLQTLNVTNTDIELDRVKHVMAAPPGENGFIKRLDEFLHQKRPSLVSMLQQEASQNEIAR
ncbi:MAG TPA: transporter substrate-binding domain-containing protein [Pyrinomonadaceae bacterium]|nr:transporter substrate-binding domain-containing protein [Pyrinomonadaceae bacterium]